MVGLGLLFSSGNDSRSRLVCIQTNIGTELLESLGTNRYLVVR